MKQHRIRKLLKIHRRTPLDRPGHWVWRRMVEANHLNSKLANRTEIIALGLGFVRICKACDMSKITHKTECPDCASLRRTFFGGLDIEPEELWFRFEVEYCCGRPVRQEQLKKLTYRARRRVLAFLKTEQIK